MAPVRVYTELSKVVRERHGLSAMSRAHREIQHLTPSPVMATTSPWALSAALAARSHWLTVEWLPFDEDVVHEAAASREACQAAVQAARNKAEEEARKLDK